MLVCGETGELLAAGLSLAYQAPCVCVYDMNNSKKVKGWCKQGDIFLPSPPPSFYSPYRAMVSPGCIEGWWNSTGGLLQTGPLAESFKRELSISSEYLTRLAEALE